MTEYRRITAEDLTAEPMAVEVYSHASGEWVPMTARTFKTSDGSEYIKTTHPAGGGQSYPKHHGVIARIPELTAPELTTARCVEPGCGRQASHTLTVRYDGLAVSRGQDELVFCTMHVAEAVEDIAHGDPPDVSVLSVVALPGLASVRRRRPALPQGPHPAAEVPSNAPYAGDDTKYRTQQDPNRELTFDEAEAAGFDPTGMDGDPRFPYHVRDLTRSATTAGQSNA